MTTHEAREARMKPILDRIPERWGKYLPDAGWDDLLLNLDQALAAIDADYQIWQAKEKFGTLRFYASSAESYGSDAVDKMFNDLITAAEAQSTYICERCGSLGASGRHGGWIKTLCDSCFNEGRRKI